MFTSFYASTFQFFPAKTDILIFISRRMAPYYGQVKDGEYQPLQKMRDRLALHTQSCPLLISATTIFNMEVLEPLQKILVQGEITEDQLAECRKIIFSLHSMEHRGEVLPVPMTATSGQGKGKTMKKDEQYRLMFNELEKYITSHCRTENHLKVLNCLLESRNKPPTDKLPLPSASMKRHAIDEKAELDLASKELNQYNKMTEREKADFNQSETKRHRSPSPGPNPKRVKVGSNLALTSSSNDSQESLFDMLVKKKRNNTKNYFSVPFVGMKSIGEKARLYLSLDRKSTEKELHAFSGNTDH